MTQEQVTLEMISKPIDILEYPIYLVQEDIDELQNGVDYLDYSMEDAQ